MEQGSKHGRYETNYLCNNNKLNMLELTYFNLFARKHLRDYSRELTKIVYDMSIVCFHFSAYVSSLK